MDQWIDLAARVLWFGNGAALKGVVVLLLTALLVRALARASAAARHLVWVLGLAGVLLASLGAWLLPTWSAGAWAAPPVFPGAGLPADTVLEVMMTPGSPPDLAETLVAQLPTALLVTWALVALALLVRVALDLAAARSLVARAAPLADPATAAVAADLARALGLAAPPTVLVSEAIDGPATIGLRRSVILLPAAYREWTPDELRGVLAHELAHAARHDCAAQAFARLVSALHWPNPLVWWAGRRLVAEREMAADDAALRAGAIASDYAGLLLHLAEGASTRPRGALSMTDGSALGERIARLLDPVRSHAPLPRRRALAGAAGVLAGALALGCLGGADPEAPSHGLWLAIAPSETALGNALANNSTGNPAAAVAAIYQGLEHYRRPDGRASIERYVTGPSAALEDFVAAGPRSDGRHRVLVEHDTDGRARTRVVDLATRVDLSHVALDVERDELGNPFLGLRFHEADAPRIAALTAAHIGERLAVVAGQDRLIAAPTIRGPIGIQGKLTFGSGATERELREVIDGLGSPRGGVVEPVHLPASQGRFLAGEQRIQPRPPLSPGENRWARFRVCVDARGGVTDVTVTKESAPGAAASFTPSVRAWPHRPYLQDGVAVPYCYPLQLNLQDRSPPQQIIATP